MPFIEISPFLYFKAPKSLFYSGLSIVICQCTSEKQGKPLSVHLSDIIVNDAPHSRLNMVNSSIAKLQLTLNRGLKNVEKINCPNLCCAPKMPGERSFTSVTRQNIDFPSYGRLSPRSESLATLPIVRLGSGVDPQRGAPGQKFPFVS
jgi:hypothetical protein